MAKDIITVDGEDVVVREDTAKAFRGVKWAHIVIISILTFMAILAIGFYLFTSKDGTGQSPAASENSTVR